jgi:hypothetical protein
MFSISRAYDACTTGGFAMESCVKKKVMMVRACLDQKLFLTL